MPPATALVPLPPAHAPNLPAPAVATPGSERMRFGAFTITETTQFPPPADAARCWVYVTLNAEIALTLDANEGLRKLLQGERARISIDGQWLWWALRRKYPQQALAKLSGSDLIHTLAARCAAQGERLLLLGSTPQRNAAAVQRLREQHPGLVVSGVAPQHYLPGTLGERRARQSALDAAATLRPHYIVMGLGACKEHRLAEALAPRLDGRVRGILCFGGAIDMASGEVRRAPAAWQQLGLEGLYRVLQQPARLGRLLRVLRVLPLLALGRY